VLQLVQELVQAGGRNQPRLWLVTQGSQPVGANDGRIAVASAPLWGFGRALALEHPQLRCAIVDLSCAADDAEIDALSEMLSSDDPADQIALRGGERYLPRLVRYSPAAAAVADPAGSPPVRADGTYVIAGGLGGLGLTIAGWLVEQGARHLALLGRSAPSAAAQAAMEAMRQRGAQVVVAQADLTDAAQLAGALADVERHMPPLRGVVYAAGLLDDCLVADLTAERLAAVLAPKVQGAWNLHLQTRGAPLEFFVLFSSAAALLGAPGQSNYAAANAFLGALAAHRRGQGLPALSINWGPWAEVGLAARPDRGGRLAERGLGSFTPAEGAAAFGRLLGHPTAQVVIMKANWQQLVEQFPVLNTQSLLLELVQADGARTENRQAAAEGSELVRRLAHVHPRERRGLLVAHIQHEVASVLGLDRSQLPEPEQGFFAMGMDSLMAVELIRRLQASLGSTLPSTLIFEYATIAALADYLAQDLIALEPPETSAQPQKQADQLDTAIGKLEQLSEDEAAALLLERLARRT
jgi:myxalamid-type polyketide synthase MxaE and MxaD